MNEGGTVKMYFPRKFNIKSSRSHNTKQKWRLQCRRLHRTRGHVPPTFKNGWTWTHRSRKTSNSKRA